MDENIKKLAENILSDITSDVSIANILLKTKVREVGACSTFGAVAVVTKTVDNGQTVVGNPAKVLVKQ